MVRVCLDRVSGLADIPILGSDAVNANYVDEKSWKTSVRVASTVNIVLNPGTTSIDGIIVSDGDRVLLKNQTNSTENGIYILTSGVYVRSNDAEAGDSASGAFVPVKEGTLNGDKLFYSTDDLNFGQSIQFSQFDEFGVTCTTPSLDNEIARFDGTTGKIIQGTGILIDDTYNVSGISTLGLSDGTYDLILDAPVLSNNITFVFPDNTGTTNQSLITNGSGILSWETRVSGPGNATDNALVRFDGSSGDYIQNSLVTLNNLGDLSGIVDLTSTGTITGDIFTDGIASLNSGTLTGLVAPVSGSDAVNKDYADTSVTGQLLTMRGNFLNPTKGGSSTKYISFSFDDEDTIDYTFLGYAGVIVKMVCIYKYKDPIEIDSGEKLSFSIGYPNNDLSVFTHYTGGTNVIEWNSSDDNTFPKSSVSLNIPITATDSISVSSVETGSVRSDMFSVNVIIFFVLS